MSDQEASRAHDQTYRRVFSHPQMLRALLEGFVEREIVEALDLEQMQQLNTKFSFKDLSVREPDVIWEVQRREAGAGPVYVLVMVEFQSSVDWAMPVRVMQYVSLAYEQALKQQGGPSAASVLPATLPIVLYNGRYRWSAPTSLRQMIGQEPEAPLSKYSPALEFLLIDVGDIDPAYLDKMGDMCAMMLRLEQPQKPAALAEQAIKFVQLLRAALPEAMREDLAIWLSELLRVAKLPVPPATILHDKESSPMFVETMLKYREELIEEGREEGREAGILRGRRDTIARQLQLKFGVDEGRAAWLDALSVAQLDLLAERLLSADAEPALRDEINALAA
jgi:hypothetical protein